MSFQEALTCWKIRGGSGKWERGILVDWEGNFQDKRRRGGVREKENCWNGKEKVQRSWERVFVGWEVCRKGSGSSSRGGRVSRLGGEEKGFQEGRGREWVSGRQESSREGKREIQGRQERVTGKAREFQGRKERVTGRQESSREDEREFQKRQERVSGKTRESSREDKRVFQEDKREFQEDKREFQGCDA